MPSPKTQSCDSAVALPSNRHGNHPLGDPDASSLALQEDIQQAANLLAAYGTKFDIGAAQVNSPLNERLTMNLIRQRSLPGDRVLCVPPRAISSHFC